MKFPFGALRAITVAAAITVTGAAALPFNPSQYPQPDSLIRFTRGLGMARTGDLAGAKAEIEAIKALRASLEKSNQSYWADRSEEQILAISAWVAFKDGTREATVMHQHAKGYTEAEFAYLAEFWSGLDEDIPSFGRIDTCLARVGITLETLMELGRQDSTLHALKSVA